MRRVWAAMCRSSRMPLLCVAMLSAGMVCAVGAVSFEQRLVPVTNYTPTAAAEAAVSALQARYYQPSTGSYGCFPALSQLTALHRDKNGRRRSVSKVETSSTSGPSVGWWNCANAVTALSDFVLAVPNASASATYIKSLENTYNRTALVYDAAHLLDGSNDDQGWWSLAWLRAYDVRAKGYFQHVSEYWDDVCNGGVWWSSKKSYKNAITNELYLMTASRLYQITGNASYLALAQREWAWFNASGMINDQFLINDGLTNNQGVILGGLVHLWQAEARAASKKPDPDSPFLHLIANLANASTTLLVDSDGVLVEPCESASGSQPCGNDGTQFKGIFVRYLGYTLAAIDATLNPLPSWWTPYQQRFVAFLQTNAKAVWSTDQTVVTTNSTPPTSQSLFGLHWDGPRGVQLSTQTQTSAVDLFTAALQFQ